MNSRAIVYTLLSNICRFLIPAFHENSHPIQWKVLSIKNTTILIFSCFLITEKSYYNPPQKSQLYFLEQDYIFPMKKAISRDQNSLVNFTKETGNSSQYQHDKGWMLDKTKTDQIERISKKTRTPLKLYPEKNIFTKFSGLSLLK